LIIGEREVADGTVTLRRYGHQQQQTFAVADFEALLIDAIKQRLPEVDTSSAYSA